MAVGDDLDFSIDPSRTVIALQGGHQSFLKESLVSVCRPFTFQTTDTYVQWLSRRRIDISLRVALLAEGVWLLMSVIDIHKEERRIQWYVEEHEGVRFCKSTGVRSDLVHPLPLPNRTEVLSPIWRKGSFDGIDRC